MSYPRAKLIQAMLAATLLTAPAQARFIYTPGPEFETQEGNSNNVVVDRDVDQRVQWFFSPVIFGTEPIVLSRLSFRYNDTVNPQGGGGNEGTWSFKDSFRLSLGTVSGTPSTTFHDNLANAVTVLAGARQQPWLIGNPAGVTKPFGVHFDFATPFVYDPAQGMLVVDMFIPTPGRFGTFDFVRDDSRAFRLFANPSANATTGFFDQRAPVIRFEASAVAVIPEAGTWAMMICGFGLLGGVTRARHPAAVSA